MNRHGGPAEDCDWHFVCCWIVHELGTLRCHGSPCPLSVSGPLDELLETPWLVSDAPAFAGTRRQITSRR